LLVFATEPNELVALILHPRDPDRWLGIPESGDPRPPLYLLHAFDASKMKMAPANPAIGNSRNNGPEMLDPP
jgi:putative SOS response-associated peptidase YedK